MVEQSSSRTRQDAFTLSVLRGQQPQVPRNRPSSVASRPPAAPTSAQPSSSGRPVVKTAKKKRGSKKGFRGAAAKQGKGQQKQSAPANPSSAHGQGFRK